MNISTNEIAQIVTNTLAQYQQYKGFVFRTPAVTLTGGNCVNRLGEMLKEFGATHVLLVADKMVYQLGLLKGCCLALERANIAFTLFAQIEGEPDTNITTKGIEALKQCKADFVLGIGGGSALDAAKAIAVMKDHQGPLENLKLGGIASRGIGLGAIPTTAGTGSEGSDITVISDLDRKIKVPIKGASLVPDFALLDPVLMLGVPPSITAATGLDTLTHAIEAYVARNANPMSKAYAFHSIETLIKALPIVVGRGDDLDMRYDMAIAAYKAGLAFSNSGLGLTHAISHQIGNLYHLPHGVVNAILLPYVMAFNALTCESLYAELAVALGVSRESMTVRERCVAAIQAVQQLVCDLGLPTSLADVQIKDGDLSQIAEQAMLDICFAGNPRQANSEQIQHLIKQAQLGQLTKGY